MELWINLAQPYVHQKHKPLFYHRQNFIVIEATPRLLLVLHDGPSQRIWFLVAHAPQSGRPREEREQWWATLSALLFTHVQSEPLIIMIDANASSGSCDDLHVFAHDDAASGNTALMY